MEHGPVTHALPHPTILSPSLISIRQEKISSVYTMPFSNDASPISLSTYTASAHFTSSTLTPPRQAASVPPETSTWQPSSLCLSVSPNLTSIAPNEPNSSYDWIDSAISRPLLVYFSPPTPLNQTMDNLPRTRLLHVLMSYYKIDLKEREVSLGGFRRV